MVSQIRHQFPSQNAVIILAHAAQNTPPPKLFSKAVLFTHLVRAFVYAEQNAAKSQINPDGPLSPKNLDSSLAKWRKLDSRTPLSTDPGEALGFIAGAKASLSGALRFLEPDSESARLARLGLSFLSVLKELETRDAVLKDKAKNYYPVFESHPFIMLGMAREVLYDLHRESIRTANKPITEDISFEPLSRIEKFYVTSNSSFPFDLRPHETPMEKVDDAVLELSDLADKIEKFKSKIYTSNHVAPHLTGHEAVSLRILGKILEPYKKGRDLSVEATARCPENPVSAPVDFESRAEKFRRKNNGIIRALPAATPV